MRNALPQMLIGAALLVLTMCTPVWSIEPPESLEAAINGGLQNHPEILAAQAKLNTARAGFDQARLEVVSKVVSTWGEMKRIREEVEHLKQAVAQAKDPERKRELEKNLVNEQASYEQRVAELHYMTAYTGGQSVASNEPAGTTVEPQVPASKLARQTLDKLVAPIKEPLVLIDAPLVDALTLLKNQYGLATTIDVAGGVNRDQPLTLDLKDCSVLAVLQAIEDYAGLQFVMRDYGLLITHPHVATDRGFVPVRKFATDYLGVDLTALEEEVVAKGK